MAASLAPIRWPANNYQLASQYKNLSTEGKRVVHDALNGIDPGSIPGQVLQGNPVYNELAPRRLIMQDSVLRGANTDRKGLNHMAFKLLDGSKSSHEVADWHLYHDGGCTYGPRNIVHGVQQFTHEYQGVVPPATAVNAPAAPAPPNHLTDFPPLGGAAPSSAHQTGHKAQSKAPSQYKL